MQVEQLVKCQLADVENHLDLARYLTFAYKNANPENPADFKDLKGLEVRVKHHKKSVSEHGQEVKAIPPSRSVDFVDFVVISDFIASLVLLSCPEHDQDIHQKDKVNQVVNGT